MQDNLTCNDWYHKIDTNRELLDGLFPLVRWDHMNQRNSWRMRYENYWEEMRTRGYYRYEVAEDEIRETCCPFRSPTYQRTWTPLWLPLWQECNLHDWSERLSWPVLRKYRRHWAIARHCCTSGFNPLVNRQNGILHQHREYWRWWEIRRRTWTQNQSAWGVASLRRQRFATLLYPHHMEAIWAFEGTVVVGGGPEDDSRRECPHSAGVPQTAERSRMRPWHSRRQTWWGAFESRGRSGWRT
jgi:hypothetical protein